MKSFFLKFTLLLVLFTSCNSTDNESNLDALYDPFSGGFVNNAPSVPEVGLNAHYPFNGNANDETANGNNGLADSPILTTDRNGITNSAYEFNGDQDHIVVLDDSKLHVNQNFTIMVWINPYNLKTQNILRKGSVNVMGPISTAYALSLSQTDQYVFTVNTDSDSKQVRHTDYNLNEWQFIVAVKNGFDLSLYVNGVKVNQDTVIGEIVYDGGSTLQIGSRSAGQSHVNTFDGKLDDIKLYERAFSSAEIIQYYNDNL
jgi:hypothetical protein